MNFNDEQTTKKPSDKSVVKSDYINDEEQDISLNIKHDIDKLLEEDNYLPVVESENDDKNSETEEKYNINFEDDKNQDEIKNLSSPETITSSNITIKESYSNQNEYIKKIVKNTEEEESISDNLSKKLEKELAKENFNMTEETFDKYIGRLSSIICTQIGSRVMQKVFQNTSSNIIEKMSSEVRT